MTKPLPPIVDDPAVVAGFETKSKFTADSQQVRGDFTIVDLVKAQRIDAIWEAANKRLTDLYADLQSRRQARIDQLETIVPVGPNIPANASSADTALLQQVFRTALAQARDALPAEISGGGNITPINTSKTTLDGMLADAEKFDDDTLRRAVLTAAFENGHLGLIKSWTDMNGLTEQLDELRDLLNAIAGHGSDNLWVVQALGLIAKPSEVFNIPNLIAAQEAAVQASYRPGGVNYQPRSFSGP